MAIEVRSLVITSTVGRGPAGGERPEPLGQEQLARFKAEILAECRIWLQDQLRLQKER